MKTALIIGHTGQDGYYLTRFLEQLKYQVVGVSSKEIYNPSSFNSVSSFIPEDRESINSLMKHTQPDEVYYLAAYHHSSTDKPVPDDILFSESIRVNCTGFVNVLEALRVVKPSCRVFYAASSHVFGYPQTYPQTEETPFAPMNIYGISKVSSIHASRYYHKQHGMFVTCGILYNHESPKRGLKFVTQKIIHGALDVAAGKTEFLELGDPDARIDWGFAPEYVEAFHKLLQADSCGSYIIASGKLHTVGYFAETAFNLLGLDASKYIRVKEGIITKQLNGNLCGDTTAIRQLTGWVPKVTLEEMIRQMLDAAKQIRA